MRYLEILLWNKCNISCWYCYQQFWSVYVAPGGNKGYSLSTSQVYKIINLMFCGANTNEKFHFCLMWGEPLLYTKKLFSSVNYIYEKSRMLGISNNNLFLNITTNWLLLDRKIVSFLRKINAHVTISAHFLSEKKLENTKVALLNKIKLVRENLPYTINIVMSNYFLTSGYLQLIEQIKCGLFARINLQFDNYNALLLDDNYKEKLVFFLIALWKIYKYDNSPLSYLNIFEDYSSYWNLETVWDCKAQYWNFGFTIIANWDIFGCFFPTVDSDKTKYNYMKLWSIDENNWIDVLLNRKKDIQKKIDKHFCPVKDSPNNSFHFKLMNKLKREFCSSIL